MGDEIVTDPNGLAQIVFLDDTKIVVGPNSRLVIDSFVFNADGTAREVTVQAARGFFRFISGNSAHEAYTIRTPTMTLGLRGTVVDIHSNSGGSRAAFLSGSGTGCDAGDFCIPFEGGCRIYEAPFGGGFTGPDGRLEQQLQLNAYFPFTQHDEDLDPAFRFDASDCVNVDNRLFQAHEEETEFPTIDSDSQQSGPYND